MGGFELVLGDLAAMASTFRTEADTYRGMVPGITPQPAASGDGSLDGLVTGVLELIGVLHEDLATTIGDHGDALAAAHDAYDRHEIDNRFLYDNLMPEEG